MPKRSKFSLSHYKLLTMNLGQLVPIGCTEVLPGDSFEQSTSVLVRASPTASPVMHPVHIMVEHWFVPYRLLWNGNGAFPSGSNIAGDDSWENWITGGAAGEQQPGSPPTIAPPYVSSPSGGWTVGSLADYLGVPPGATALNLGFPGEGVSALPFRAYNLIYNEWYRDEDLTTDLSWGNGTYSGAGGLQGGVASPDAAAQYLVRNRSWQKDYFTTSRPWAQKGPVVTLPLGNTAPVVLNPAGAPYGSDKFVESTTGAPISGEAGLGVSISGLLTGLTSGDPLTMDPNGSLVANLAAATGVTIDALRQALAVQRFEEMRARWGSRYSEYLASLGIKSSDARLQRPEFLGGGRQTLQWSEVLQTSNPGTPSGVDGPGALYGHGIGATRSNRYRRFFEEHGVVMTLCSVLPITIYEQSLDKQFSRTSLYDWFQKEFQFVGQQEVKNSEVYVHGAFTDGTFGYQDRYDEYRREESTVAGQFRAGQTFEYWHLGRNFSAAPALNSSFVVSNPSNRVFLDQTDNQLFVMASHSIRARRIVAAKANPRTF